jgi:hypothetical protein
LVLPAKYLRHGAFVQRASSSDGITWAVSPRPGPEALLVTVPGTYLTTRDALLLGEFGRRYLLGMSKSRVLSFSLAEAATAMGLEGHGGAQNRKAAAAVRRLTLATVSWAGPYTDANGEVFDSTFDYHLLDASGTWVSDRAAAGQVRLSEETVALLEDGLLAYLATPVCRALVRTNDHAAKLWMFLESERLRGWFSYHIMRPVVDGRPMASGQVYIAEVLGIEQWTNPRDIRNRIVRAVDDIEAADPGRYQFNLTGKAAVTILHVRRKARPRRQRRTEMLLRGWKPPQGQ